MKKIENILKLKIFLFYIVILCNFNVILIQRKWKNIIYYIYNILNLDFLDFKGQ